MGLRPLLRLRDGRRRAMTSIVLDENVILGSRLNDSIPLQNVEPTPLTVELTKPVMATNDAYSSRIRCDHPPDDVDGRLLGEQLLDEAEAHGRGRVVVLAPPAVASGLVDAGFELEGRMEGFYAGDDDCHVMGAYPDPERAELGWPAEVEKTQQILEAVGPGRSLPNVMTRRAGVADAPAVAELIGDTFKSYPTPSDDPEYIADAIESGVPFRMIEVEGEVVACASADLVPEAMTAELTDCSTKPEHRGNGYMQAILTDLMGDLRDLEYPTAFTLARARIPGMNIAFQRLGFELCGTMPQSCRIGDGIEDMNIWSRSLIAS